MLYKKALRNALDIKATDISASNISVRSQLKRHDEQTESMRQSDFKRIDISTPNIPGKLLTDEEKDLMKQRKRQKYIDSYRNWKNCPKCLKVF